MVDKYCKGGSHHAVFEKLRRLRHERLAHRCVASEVTGFDATDDEIESFYQDNSSLVALLLSLVEAMAYDPNDTAEIYRFPPNSFGLESGERERKVTRIIDRYPRVIRISITAEAFAAIERTMPVGSVAVERECNAKGEREIWLEPHMVAKLRYLRGPGGAGEAKY